MPRFTPINVAIVAAQAKKKSTRAVLALLSIVVITLSLTSDPKSTIAFSSGSGTIADPYVISNCTELQSINDDPEYMLASYVLSGNIDCTSVSPFVPIGIPQIFDGNYLPFMGRFDGQGYTISNVTMGSAGDSNIGLFAETQGASIRDVALDNVTLDAFGMAGALVARANQTAIVGISVTNSTITLYATNSVTGGAIAGRFLDSYGYGLYASSTSVVATGSNVSSGGGMVGGLIGNMVRSTIDRSYAGVTVTADFYNVGGIVGGIQVGSVLKDLYSDSVVTGYSAVGGIVGSFAGSGGNDYIIHNVYSNASTTATLSTARVGGILGSKNGALSAQIKISNSFAVGRVSSTTNSGAISGIAVSPASNLSNNIWYPTGTGQTRCTGPILTVSPTQCTSVDSDTYYNSSSNAPMTSWDFVNVWDEVSGNRPALQVFPFTEAGGPVGITSCSDLAVNMRTNPNGWFTLSNDIDCAGDSSLLPLLGNTASSSAFMGTFDGQGFTISNITMSRSAPSPQYLGGLGLFAKLFGATVSNLTMTGGGVTSLSADLNGIGGLAGYGHGLVVESVTSTVPVNTGDFSGGGLLGDGSGRFSDVHVAADVSYTYNPADDPYGVGGIIGIGSNVIITNSSYTGNVNSYWSVGGLLGEVGLLRADGLTATGSIIGSVGVGGVVGNAYSGVNLNSYINNSSSTVSISPNDSVDGYFEGVGGLTGRSDYLDITNGSYIGTINIGTGGYGYVGGLAGDFDGKNTATSTISNSTVDAIILADGDNGTAPYIQNVGGLVGIIGRTVEIENTIASSTITFGADNPAEYINGFYKVGGLIGSGNAYPWSITNTEARGSITIYDDYSGASGGYGYGLGGLIGEGSYGTIRSATSSVDVFLKSYESGAVGGLIGDGGDFQIFDTHVTGSVTVQDPGSTYDVGGFIGYSYNNTIATSSARGSVTLLDTYGPYEIGGFIGASYDDVIQQTYTDNTLTIDMGNDGTSTGYNIGGFIGAVSGDTLTDTYASTTVNITSAALNNTAGTDIGGYAGTFYNYGAGDTVTNAYSSGSLSLVADVTAPFQRIGGFIGSSNEDIDSFSNTFTVTSIPAMASSTNVGGFIGSYNGGETFSNNAFDATVTGQTLCTGIDAIDPAWCTVRNVASAEPTYFFSSANAPQSSWDFTNIWLVRTGDYPIFGSAAPAAPAPPTVSTSASVATITQTGATTTGSISSLGSGTITSRGFRYGVTPFFGATTTEASAGFSTGSFSASLTGLICNTTYYFDAYASGTDGSDYGATESFTTSACGPGSTPPTVSTASTASGITKTQATASGNISALGTAPVTTRGFTYGLTTSFGATTTESSSGFTTGTFSTLITGLTCNTTYSYAAYALSADGIDYGTIRTFTTESCSSSSTGTKVKKKDSVITTPVPVPPPVVIPTPPLVPVPTTQPIVKKPTTQPIESIEVCGSGNKSTKIVTALDTSSSVTTSVPSESVYSSAAKDTGADEYSVYLTVTPVNGKGVQKQIDKFVTLLSTIASKRDEDDKLPYGLVKKVGTVSYIPPKSSDTVQLPVQNNSQLKLNTTELRISSNPCDGVSEIVQPISPIIPSIKQTPDNEEVVIETESLEDSIVGESILNFDLDNLTVQPPELLVPAFEILASDEFGNVLNNFEKPFEVEVTILDSVVNKDEIYVTALSDDGVTWFEVPFTIEGNSIKITINEPGKFFIWRIPKVIAAEDDVIAGTTEPVSFYIPLWLVNLLSVLGLTSGAALLIALLSKIPFSLTHLRRIFVQAAHNLFALLTFKKKRQPWGTVYDSKTKAPVDPAYVELFDLEGNKQAEAITDLDGRYGFLVSEGSYVMNVRKTNYLFPSKIQKLSKQDIIYSNLYQGGEFTVSGTVAHDVPMDPEVFDWNQYEKIRTKQTKFFSKIDPFVVGLLDVLFLGGTVAVILQFLSNITLYTTIILVLYAALLIARLFGGKPPLFGTIWKDNKVLQFAVIRISKNEREVATKVTDKYGRYVAILEPGTYDISVEERIGEDNYETILHKSVRVKSGVFNKNLKIS